MAPHKSGGHLLHWHSICETLVLKMTGSGVYLLRMPPFGRDSGALLYISDEFLEDASNLLPSTNGSRNIPGSYRHSGSPGMTLSFSYDSQAGVVGSLVQRNTDLLRQRKPQPSEARVTGLLPVSHRIYNLDFPVGRCSVERKPLNLALPSGPSLP